MQPAVRIYNLFPLLAGPMDRWPLWLDRASSMNFNWVYINPFHYPGFSGSLYAVKDHRRLHPLFVPQSWTSGADCNAALRRLVREAESRGLSLMADLVINHTAKDSVLAEEHPEWFCRDTRGRLVSPSAIDPADARRVTVWGDLALVDNRGSPDREGLWQYWEDLVVWFCELGFRGFRCDAAYQVPSELWQRLISRARKIHPDCVFFAETLGCRLPEVEALAEAGFTCIANSSKWWNFSEKWCLRQQQLFRTVAPSVSFPESHDTPRLAAETGGLRCVQVQRYAFAAAFSYGVLMPMGYELGFKKKLNVVRTRPEDYEEPRFDISKAVGLLNRLKAQEEVLAEEGETEALWGLEGPVLCLRKKARGTLLLILINKSWHETHTVQLGNVRDLIGAARGRILYPPDRSAPAGPQWEVELEPAEVILLRGEHGKPA